MLYTLNGLIQASQAWGELLTTCLRTLGFMGFHADPSLFWWEEGDTVVLLLVHVDDIILVGNKYRTLEKSEGNSVIASKLVRQQNSKVSRHGNRRYKIISKIS